MTVEIVYSLPKARSPSKWQVSMAEQIERNSEFSIQNIQRELNGTELILRVETGLPDTAVENMLSDIEDYLPATASHVETREV